MVTWTVEFRNGEIIEVDVESDVSREDAVSYVLGYVEYSWDSVVKVESKPAE